MHEGIKERGSKRGNWKPGWNHGPNFVLDFSKLTLIHFKYQSIEASDINICGYEIVEN